MVSAQDVVSVPILLILITCMCIHLDQLSSACIHVEWSTFCRCTQGTAMLSSTPDQDDPHGKTTTLYSTI